jgi:hypothetical protein
MKNFFSVYTAQMFRKTEEAICDIYGASCNILDDVEEVKSPEQVKILKTAISVSRFVLKQKYNLVLPAYSPM